MHVTEPLAITATQTAAWIGVVAAILGLGKQAYDVLRHRRREKREIAEALDRQPLVREQLELGNVGEAVKHLTAIIETMAKQKERDDTAAAARVQQLEDREDELEGLLKGCHARCAAVEAWAGENGYVLPH